MSKFNRYDNNELIQKRVFNGKDIFISSISTGDIPSYSFIRSILKEPSCGPLLDNWGIKYACEHGHIELVKELLANPLVDPSCNDYLPLKLAMKNKYKMENRYKSIILLLLKDSRINGRIKLLLLTKSKYQDDCLLSCIPGDIINEIIARMVNILCN